MSKSTHELILLSTYKHRRRPQVAAAAARGGGRGGGGGGKHVILQLNREINSPEQEVEQLQQSDS